MSTRWWSGRPLLLEAGLVVLATLIGGVLGLVVAVVAVVAVELGFPARRLPLVGLFSLAMTPLTWILGNLSRWDEITFALVTANPWPNRFALAAVVLLFVGVALDVRATLPRDAERSARGSGEDTGG